MRLAPRTLAPRTMQSGPIFPDDHPISAMKDEGSWIVTRTTALSK